MIDDYGNECRGEVERLRARVAELEAQWERVPWEAMRVCAEYTWRTLSDGDPALDSGYTLRVYVLNNAPKEAE